VISNGYKGHGAIKGRLHDPKEYNYAVRKQRLIMKYFLSLSLSCVYFSSLSVGAICRRFDPGGGGSLDRRVNCRRVSQPRWVGARRSTKGARKRETGRKGETRGLCVAQRPGRCACSRGLQASAWERARDFARRPVPPRGQPLRTRALYLPFIGVRRGPRCTRGDVAVC
jgi:hypothetical protein